MLVSPALQPIFIVFLLDVTSPLLGRHVGAPICLTVGCSSLDGCEFDNVR